jgi:hypothetical protein
MVVSWDITYNNWRQLLHFLSHFPARADQVHRGRQRGPQWIGHSQTQRSPAHSEQGILVRFMVGPAGLEPATSRLYGVRCACGSVVSAGLSPGAGHMGAAEGCDSCQRLDKRLDRTSAHRIPSHRSFVMMLIHHDGVRCQTASRPLFSSWISPASLMSCTSRPPPLPQHTPSMYFTNWTLALTTRGFASDGRHHGGTGSVTLGQGEV